MCFKSVCVCVQLCVDWASSIHVEGEMKNVATFLAVSNTADLENTWAKLQGFNQQQQKNKDWLGCGTLTSTSSVNIHFDWVLILFKCGHRSVKQSLKMAGFASAWSLWNPAKRSFQSMSTM